jgi:hypothetical protein
MLASNLGLSSFRVPVFLTRYVFSHLLAPSLLVHLHACKVAPLHHPQYALEALFTRIRIDRQMHPFFSRSGISISYFDDAVSDLGDVMSV